MRLPIVCLDARLRQFTEVFAPCFSRPQCRHFVTVLLALLLCRGPRTLTNLRRQVVAPASLASLSRFLAEAPWSESGVAATWRARFDVQVLPLVVAEHARQRAARPRRRGRPPVPVVTGYLIGDDSTLHKSRGRKMEGLGQHYSTTAAKPVTGHSLVQALYMVQGRRCPLAPRLYRQQTVCATEGVPFRSKVDLLVEQITTFTPVPGTQTHVLLDSWYTAKRVWQATRARGFLITSGLKSNRALRVPDPTQPCGWRWQRVSEYAASLTATDYQPTPWPRQGGAPRQVWVHVVSTRVRKLYQCQVVLVRETLDAPPSQVRYWASSDLEADVATLVGHIAARWAIEVLFADTKEVLGLDHYQVMSAPAIVRFWTLALAAYVFLEEERDRLSQTWGRPVTIGEAHRQVQRIHHEHLITWLHQQFLAGAAPHQVSALLAA